MAYIPTLDSFETTDLEDSGGALRSLTVGSVLTTPSSFASRWQHGYTSQPFTARDIGEGLQGAVFEYVGIVGSAPVLKKEHPKNACKSKNLRNEFAIHQRVYDTFRSYWSFGCQVSVPRPYRLFRAEEATCQAIIDSLPCDFRKRSDMYQMDHILPLPKVIRRALIQKFYPHNGNGPLDSDTLGRVLGHIPNKDCLVRPYLGLKSKIYTRQEFYLRNFVLSLQSLVEIGFDVKDLATSLGRAYATMHWGAHVDGDDVEFVLGSEADPCLKSTQGQVLQTRKIGLYLIDFGQCERVDMTNEPQVVYQAFKGAMVTGDNRYFIPNPRHSLGLFRIFVDSYAQTAQAFVDIQGLSFDIADFIGQYKEYVGEFL